MRAIVSTVMLFCDRPPDKTSFSLALLLRTFVGPWALIMLDRYQGCSRIVGSKSPSIIYEDTISLGFGTALLLTPSTTKIVLI
jgi:hypothetical protein